MRGWYPGLSVFAYLTYEVFFVSKYKKSLNVGLVSSESGSVKANERSWVLTGKLDPFQRRLRSTAEEMAKRSFPSDWLPIHSKRPGARDENLVKK